MVWYCVMEVTQEVVVMPAGLALPRLAWQDCAPEGVAGCHCRCLVGRRPAVICADGQLSCRERRRPCQDREGPVESDEVLVRL